MSRIMFSRPVVAGLEESYLREALASTVWHGDGEFTRRATDWLTHYTGAGNALLTTSGTHALELAAILLELGPGDEVICPSFTFPSTAAAIAIRGATPVFVDVEAATLNIDPEAVEMAVTERTRALFIVHYGGVAADLDALQTIADNQGLAIVEDNAHGLGGYLDGRHLGTFGALGTQSWHDTKNVTCGEGGALLVNDARFLERAEVVREKGTNRAQFLRGAIDKYSWVDQGSSYLPSDLLAALLMAQFERFDWIQTRRHRVWARYRAELGEWADRVGAQMMTVPDRREHPAHMFYVLMPTHADQSGLIRSLAERGIVAAFHYQPLHSSVAGLRYGCVSGDLPVTERAAQTLVRLPLHPGLTEEDASKIVAAVRSYRPVRHVVG